MRDGQYKSKRKLISKTYIKKYETHLQDRQRIRSNNKLV